MRVTFINRNTKNFKPATEIAEINSHRAHIRYDRRHKKAAAEAAAAAARGFNVQILSYIDKDDESSSSDVLPIGSYLPVMFQQIGGLRSDPFWTLPVENAYHAMTGFDYHFQVMCPLALGLGNYNNTQHQIMRINVLETAMYCSSMIAFDLVMQSLHMDSSQRLSRAALYHVNNALAGLREALGDPVLGTSDIVLATIFPMAVVYRMLSDWAAYNAHVEGVRRIVTLRGGLDNLGWEGFLKTSAIGMFESADVLHRQQTQRLLQDEALGISSPSPSPSPAAAAAANNDDAVQELEYPSRLPTEALRFQISQYPHGIAALALNSRLSVQFLNFFRVFFDWMVAVDTTPGPHGAMTELGHDILGMPKLSFIERLLAVAIQAYINWFERTRRKWSNFASEHEVEVHIGVLRRAETDVDVRIDDRKDALVWSCLMIRDTTARGSGSWRWADSQISRMDVDGEELQRLDRLFFARPGSTLNQT